MANSGWLRRLYLPLAVASLVVCAVFFPIIGTRHLIAVVAIGVVAPLGLATSASRWSLQWPREEVRQSIRFAVVLFLVGCAKFATLGSLSSGFMPTLHDEWSYLFGAQTFALGRFSNPPPPHPEFFDAIHILTEPRWVTRYPPGHPIVLALGVQAGWPPLVVIAMTAGTLVWLYLLGREMAGEVVGRLAGALALLSPGLDYLASSYLSQSTFLFAITGCYVCSVRAARLPSAMWCLAAGVLGGWAILIRPYSAAALGVPVALWFLWQSRARSWLLYVAAALPLITALCLFAVYNWATTGNPWRTAWEEYNRQFEPNNTLGFAAKAPLPVPGGLNERKAIKAKTIAEEKQRFTWEEALRRSLADPKRLSQMVFPAVGFYGLIAFCPFSWLRNQRGPGRIEWLLLSGIAMQYLAYSFFYSTWGAYGHETIALIVVLVAGGLAHFWRQAEAGDRPSLALAVPLALMATIALYAFVQLPGFIHQRRQDASYHRRFEQTLAELGDIPSLVFVRLDPGERHGYDAIHNSPDLGSRVLIVFDLGVSRNLELMRAFPDRQAYLFDEARWRLRPWATGQPPR